MTYADYYDSEFQLRGTGRTTRMLKGIIASTWPKGVTVVAVNSVQARFLRDAFKRWGGDMDLVKFVGLDDKKSMENLGEAVEYDHSAIARIKARREKESTSIKTDGQIEVKL